MFKTLKRTGIISSSGRSDNFVRIILLRDVCVHTK